MYKLFHGKDSFLSFKEAQKEYNKLVNQNPEFESHVIDAETTTPENIVELYQTSSLFSPGKVIFIKRMYKSPHKDELITNVLEFLENKIDNSHLLFWEDQKIRATTKYYKFFNKNKSLFESPNLNKRTFISWASKEAQAHALTINNELLTILAQKTNYQSERFINELEKLKLTEKKKITADMVQDLSVDTLQNDIWELIDTINTPNRQKKAIEITDRLLSQQIDPNFILAMITRNTRLLIQVKSLYESGNGNKEISSYLKIPPFTVPSLLNSARNQTDESLMKIYSRLYNLDFEIKLGNIEPRLGLTLLVSKL